MNRIEYLNGRLAACIGLQSFVLAICLSIVLACSSRIEAQTRNAASSVAVPETVARFMKMIGPEPSGEVILNNVREQLWEVYVDDNGLKKSLVGFLTSSRTRPALRSPQPPLFPSTTRLRSSQLLSGPWTEGLQKLPGGIC